MPQLLVTINDQSMLPSLRRVIKSLRGVDQVVIPREKKLELNTTQKRQLARLEKLAMLEENWDDEGAFPIECGVITIIRKIIMADGEQILKDWTLFPATNGTIQLKAKRKRAVVSVGNNDFSYIYHRDYGVECGNHEKLTTNRLRMLIKHINE